MVRQRYKLRLETFWDCIYTVSETWDRLAAVSEYPGLGHDQTGNNQRPLHRRSLNTVYNVWLQWVDNREVKYVFFPKKRKEKRWITKIVTMQEWSFSDLVLHCVCTWQKRTKPSRSGLNCQTIEVRILHKFLIGNKPRKWSRARKIEEGKKNGDVIFSE